MTFATKKQLTDWLEMNFYIKDNNGNYYWPGTYYLRHGEYERPEYAARRYKDGWSLYARYYYYQGTFNAPEDGRVSEEFFLN